MKKKKKKVSKSKKKFFIILSCYIVVFVLTFVITASTLAWFSSSTWSSDIVYLGGPVYLYFSDTSGVKETSKENSLTVETPPGWDKLYPGMNIRIGSRAVIQGAEFTHEEESGDVTTIYATGAVLRARVYITVTDPLGSTTSSICQDVYNNIWGQITYKATHMEDDRNEGVWVMDDDYNYITHTEITDEDTSNEEDHFFYYVNKNQSFENSGKYELMQVGGSKDPMSVGFLDQAILTLSGMQLNNTHADCTIKFTIIFHALQAFLPYTLNDLGKPYLGNTTGRPTTVQTYDLGLPKPLTIENSRSYFYESFKEIYVGNDDAIY